MAGDLPTQWDTALWAYPWDIAQWGIGETASRLRDAGISTLSVAALYHSAQVLSLASGIPKFFTSASGPLFDFRQDFWQQNGVEIRPRQFFPDLAHHLAQAGIGLRGWTVTGHDQTGLSSVINAFGQPSAHASCPVANRKATRQMVGELAALRAFSGLDMESVGFTSAFHGAHHEITGVPLTPLLQMLMSVCFCPECRSEFDTVIDWQAFQEQVREGCLLLLHKGEAPLDHMVEMAEYLAEHPVMSQFLAKRGEVLESIMRDAAVAGGALRLAFMAMPYARQSQLAWMEGVRAHPALPGNIVILGYGHASQIRSDLQWLYGMGWMPPRITVGITLAASMTPSRQEAADKVEAALDMGIRQFCFYNLGILGTERWGWLAPLTTRIREAG